MKLIESITAAPWFCAQAHFDALLANIAKITPAELNLSADAPYKTCKRPSMDVWGNPIAQLEMRDGVGIVPVHGPLAARVDPFDKWAFGVTDYADIREDIETALASNAKAIVLDIASPGGSVIGLPELAHFIRDTAASVPVISFNGYLSASAAEYLSMGASERIASPSAINGSIGTIATLVSWHEYLAKAGINVRLFTSGDLKATGHPLGPITDAQAAWLQADVDRYGADFRAWVRENRGEQVPDDALRGQTFSTADALKINLLDGMAGSLDEVVARATGTTPHTL